MNAATLRDPRSHFTSLLGRMKTGELALAIRRGVRLLFPFKNLREDRNVVTP